jgi:glycosyltransferase involved in cell wall biosynthesis
MEDAWADVDAAGEWLLALAAEREPDLIHLNDFSHGCLPFVVPRVVAAHSDVLSWWDAVIGGSVPTTWNTYRRRVRAGLLGADLTVAVSESLAAAMEPAYGVKPPVVIYNGRDSRDWLPGVKRDMVFGSGRVWDEAKNLRALDAAASGLRWPVFIAGALESPDGHRAELKHAQSVGTLPAHQMREWFGAASIYALPARYEPFGLSVLEAALSGCALVLGDIPSLRELWNGCAVFVRPGSTAELQAALTTLIESPERRIELAATARERAESYTIERMKTAWLQAYEHAADRAAHRRREAPACVS